VQLDLIWMTTSPLHHSFFTCVNIPAFEEHLTTYIKENPRYVETTVYDIGSIPRARHAGSLRHARGADRWRARR
jgi:hypothetical protein